MQKNERMRAIEATLLGQGCGTEVFYVGEADVDLNPGIGSLMVRRGSQHAIPNTGLTLPHERVATMLPKANSRAAASAVESIVNEPEPPDPTFTSAMRCVKNSDKRMGIGAPKRQAHHAPSGRFFFCARRR